MHIVSVMKVGHSLVITIPHQIHRAWRLQRGARMVIEQTETGRATFRPLEVTPYDPLAGRRNRTRRDR